MGTRYACVSQKDMQAKYPHIFKTIRTAQKNLIIVNSISVLLYLPDTTRHDENNKRRDIRNLN